MSEYEETSATDEAAPIWRQRRFLVTAAAALSALALASAAGWALSGHNPARPATPAAAPATPSVSVAPSSPSPSPSPSASPSPSPSPTTEPTTQAPADTPAETPANTAPTTAHWATKTPLTQISPRPCTICSAGSPAPGPSCARNAAGQIMTCDPVQSGIPLPRPDTSPSRFTAGTVPPGGGLG